MERKEAYGDTSSEDSVSLSSNGDYICESVTKGLVALDGCPCETSGAALEIALIVKESSPECRD